MSNIKELIRQNIDAYYAEYKDKFHQNGDPYHLGIIDGLDIAERILDTLPDEPVTDCHGLEDEIIDKWRMIHRAGNEIPFDTFNGIACHFAKWGAEHLADTNKTSSEDLEEAAEAYSRQVSRGHNYRDLTCGFIAGAKWQKEQETREMIMSDGSYFQKCYELGKKDMKEQMIEGAEEGEVQEFYRDEDGIHCCVSVGTDYKPGTIVYVITIPKEEGQ